MSDFGENEFLDLTTPPEERVILPKKKFGFFGKLIAFLLVFIIGIGSLCGTIFYISKNVKIKKIGNWVEQFTNFNYQSWMEKDYFSEAVGEETILELLVNLTKTAKEKKLAPFCDYFPVLEGFIDDFVQDLNEGFGIDADTSEVLETPLTDIPTYLSDKISTAELGKIMKATSSTGELDPLMEEICYPNGNAITIADLSSDTKGVIDNVKLSSLLGATSDNKIVMFLLYGKEGVQYEIIDDVVTPLQMQIAIKDGKVYDYFGDEMPEGYTFEDNVYIDAKQKQHYLADPSGESVIIDEVSIDLYYVKDENENYITYASTTVGDLTGDNGALSTITKRMTVGELMGEDKMDSNKILKHLKDATIDTLPDQISGLTFGQVFTDDIYDAETNEMKGVWKYMLKDKDTTDDPETFEDERIEVGLNYSITNDMSKIMNNMTANMKNATLLELDEDQIISMDNLDTPLASALKAALSDDMKSELGLNDNPDKEITVGSLTVNQMLNVMLTAITLINGITQP